MNINMAFLLYSQRKYFDLFWSLIFIRRWALPRPRPRRLPERGTLKSILLLTLTSVGLCICIYLYVHICICVYGACGCGCVSYIYYMYISILHVYIHLYVYKKPNPANRLLIASSTTVAYHTIYNCYGGLLYIITTL